MGRSLASNRPPRCRSLPTLIRVVSGRKIISPLACAPRMNRPDNAPISRKVRAIRFSGRPSLLGPAKACLLGHQFATVTTERGYAIANQYFMVVDHSPPHKEYQQQSRRRILRSICPKVSTGADRLLSRTNFISYSVGDDFHRKSGGNFGLRHLIKLRATATNMLARCVFGQA